MNEWINDTRLLTWGMQSAMKLNCDFSSGSRLEFPCLIYIISYSTKQYVIVIVFMENSLFVNKDLVSVCMQIERRLKSFLPTTKLRKTTNRDEMLKCLLMHLLPSYGCTWLFSSLMRTCLCNYFFLHINVSKNRLVYIVSIWVVFSIQALKNRFWESLLLRGCVTMVMCTLVPSSKYKREHLVFTYVSRLSVASIVREEQSTPCSSVHWKWPWLNEIKLNRCRWSSVKH